MLSYVYLGTNDLERAARFYDATLGALGMQRCVTHDPGWDRISAGWGLYEDDGVRELAVWVGLPFNQEAARARRASGPDTTRATSWRRCVAASRKAQKALFTTPPSTRSAAPVVADDSGLATYATSDATSSV